MTETDFLEEMQARQTEIEELVKRFLPKEIAFQKTVADAMEYSLMAGGKRIRPILMKETFLMFGGKNRNIIEPYMAAMEMIHTYSLVHDDLPAMDNDDYRRGKLTTHKKYGEDMGILTGDALLNYAYETAATAFAEKEELEKTTCAFQILSRKAGILGMVGGQVADVEQTGKPLTKELLDFIYRLKTGALLEGSLMIGAALAGATSEEIAIMEKIGTNVGMAFQIQDDILDCTSTTQELGKPVHSDEKNDKTTFVAIYGMEKAKEAVKEYSEEALEWMEQLNYNNEFLSVLIEKLIYRKK